MTTPRRIQLRRTKGYRKPPGAVVVARPGKWGNPYRVLPVPVYHGRSVVGMRWRVVRDDLPLTVPGEIFRYKSGAHRLAVDLHRAYVLICLRGPAGQALRDAMDAELRGRDLACWCPLDQPCHADVLLEVANR